MHSDHTHKDAAPAPASQFRIWNFNLLTSGESMNSPFSLAMKWDVYCGHCGRPLFACSVPVSGLHTCPTCSALNRFDTANPKAQTYELPTGHTCDLSKCNLGVRMSA